MNRYWKQNEFQTFVAPSDVDFACMYQAADSEEIRRWQELGGSKNSQAWTLPDGRLLMPKAWVPKHLRVLHQCTYWGANKLAESILRHWYAPGAHQYAKAILKNSVICAGYNPKREP